MQYKTMTYTVTEIFEEDTTNSCSFRYYFSVNENDNINPLILYLLVYENGP